MDSRTKGKEPKTTARAGQPKRRSCDECRARKLACSKEPDGCTRCKRDGILCNYSLQKPMGRPRKRPRGETEAEADKDSQSETSAQVQQPQQMPISFEPQAAELDLNSFDFDFAFDPTVGMDLDLSFLDMDNPNLNFFDLVQTQDFPSSLNIPNDDYLSQPDYLLDPDPKINFAPEIQYDHPPAAGWHAGGLASVDIDFNPGPQPPPPPQAPEFSPEGAAALITSSLSPESLDSKTPGLSPDSSGQSSTSEPPLEEESHDLPADSGVSNLVAFEDSDTPTTARPRECQCFSKLYLALDALQHLPPDFDSAMAVTRNAAKTAYYTVVCPVCGDPPLEIHFRAGGSGGGGAGAGAGAGELAPDHWMRPFQNLMMLGALLPSLSNAYVRILKMVDAEASKAEAENRKIIFKLEEYGGVWGRAAEEHAHCSMALSVEGVHLEPSMWRMTARALLKFDVYGYSRVGELSIAGVEDERPFVQIGLKDIMNMMEERSKRRHEQLDALVAEGKLSLPSNCCTDTTTKQQPPNAADRSTHGHGGEKPQCMVIIDIAKKSMADLVIP